MATPIFNHKKTQLVMALEATMGTAVTLAAADNNIKWIPDSISIDIDMEQWQMFFASGRHSQGPATIGKKMVIIKAQAPLMAAAAVDTAPKIGKAFKSCGALETIVATTSVAYTPDPTKDQGDGVTATFALIFVPTSGGCIVVTVKGAMGTFKLMLNKSGEPFMADFEWKGALVSISDGTALALTSPDTGYAPGTIGAAVSAAGVAQQISKMGLDAGNVVEFDEDMGDSSNSGYATTYIGTRVPKWNMDPKARLLAVDPAFTRQINNTEVVLSHTTAAIGGVKYTISAPKGQLEGKMPFGKRGTMLAWEQTYGLHESAGADEWKILQSA